METAENIKHFKQQSICRGSIRNIRTVNSSVRWRNQCSYGHFIYKTFRIASSPFVGSSIVLFDTFWRSCTSQTRWKHHSEHLAGDWEVRHSFISVNGPQMHTEAIKIYASVARVEMCFLFYCEKKTYFLPVFSSLICTSASWGDGTAPNGTLTSRTAERLRRSATPRGLPLALRLWRSPSSSTHWWQTIIIHDETVFMRSKLITAISIVHTQSLFAFC